MKEKVKQLRKNGHSYSEIAELVGKSRKFAWRIAKDIQFNKKGLKRYHKNVKGILKQIKPQNKTLSLSKVRIIGHLLFDGTVYKKDYHYIARYINSSKELINQFVLDMKKVYGINPTSLEVFKGKNNLNHHKVSFSCRVLYEDLMIYFESYSTSNQNIRIPNSIMNAEKNIKLEFLRTFFEDEGSISSNYRIMGDSKSEVIIRQIINMLKEFELLFRLCRYKQYTGYMYKIYLPKTKENLTKFYRLKLFDKAIITHGVNSGRKKLDVLKEFIEKKETTSQFRVL